MRTYPNNSPQAAARIVALAVLADGQVCKAEINRSSNPAPSKDQS